MLTTPEKIMSTGRTSKKWVAPMAPQASLRRRVLRDWIDPLAIEMAIELAIVSGLLVLFGGLLLFALFPIV